MKYCGVSMRICGVYKVQTKGSIMRYVLFEGSSLWIFLRNMKINKRRKNDSIIL